ncbi:Glycosyltransferase bc10 [Thalictrum thalictroides]|uniref:Glycosyltransferase bc10 n=1 Tax=Thalictrum thalictroides TaxID=46969 RepID=A0A7J6XAR7_THATH|nr:Glycosyltransferase bc10 [Thalictrum thalictroides]
MLRSKADEEQADMYRGSLNKDLSFRLVKVVSTLVIFVAGVVFGLVASAHVSGRIRSQSELFFPPNHPPQPSVFKNENCSTIEKSSGKENFLNFTRFLHPENLTHFMKDDELFWRASMVPKKENYPYTRVPKVAFMFLTRGPLPLAPLWDKFFEGHEEFFSVYVHALPGYKLNVSSTSAFYNRQIPSKDVRWGTIELAASEKRLLANALLDLSNERFVLLSESCIPVYDFDTVYKYLIGSAQSFVEAYDDPSRYGRGRYHRRMYPDIKLYQWRKGSQWFELNRVLAVNIISDTKYYSIFKKYCKPSCYPDEHYLPTLLNMFYGSLNSKRTLTWVDWSKGGPHPVTYVGVNITEGFIESIRNNGTMCSYKSQTTYNTQMTSVCYLFARKFAPDTLVPLLNLTSTVMNF